MSGVGVVCVCEEIDRGSSRTPRPRFDSTGTRTPVSVESSTRRRPWKGFSVSNDNDPRPVYPHTLPLGYYPCHSGGVQ